MRRYFLVTILVFSTIACFSQSKEIVGAWLWRDSVNAIQFFINADGTVEKRSGSANDYVWNPRKAGRYIFKDHRLVITWADKSTERGSVTFIDGFTAEFHFTKPKSKVLHRYIFKKIVDEEVMSDK